VSTVLLKIIIVAGTLLYYASLALHFVKKRKAARKVSNIMLCAAWLLNLAVVINNWAVNGYVPFVTIFQVLTFIAMLFGPILAYMWFVRDAEWMKPFFITAAAILMTGLCFMPAKAESTFRPALQSIWFLPHVLLYTIAYTLAFVAFLVAVRSMLTKDPEKKRILDNGIYGTACIAFPFMTLALCIGAIWANEIWGAFWSWDNKENWALVSWLTYMLYLHFRRNKKLSKFSNLLIIIGFVFVVVTLFFSGGGQHSYL